MKKSKNKKPDRKEAKYQRLIADGLRQELLFVTETLVEQIITCNRLAQLAENPIPIPGATQSAEKSLLSRQLKAMDKMSKYHETKGEWIGGD